MTAPTWTFDAARFGGALVQHREQAALSTREVARRADVSQSYVVALEGARHRGTGPTPTVDIVARLAGALGVSPTALFRTALRRQSTHVLLVVDGSHTSSVPLARRTAEGAHHWVVATNGGSSPHADHTIALRANVSGDYLPAQVEQSLRNELAPLRSALGGTDVGFVFDDTSTVMHASGTPHAVLDFEPEWARVVNDAAEQIGAHAAWNVCVYAIEHLMALDDPVAATVELMRHHDTTWFGHAHDLAVGQGAANQVLHRLRPLSIDDHEWATTVKRLTSTLTFAA